MPMPNCEPAPSLAMTWPTEPKTRCNRTFTSKHLYLRRQIPHQAENARVSRAVAMAFSADGANPA